MGPNRTRDESVDDDVRRREILDAVEAWLVDPRPRPRLQHQATAAVHHPIAEIRLDGDPMPFGLGRARS